MVINPTLDLGETGKSELVTSFEPKLPSWWERKHSKLSDLVLLVYMNIIYVHYIPHHYLSPQPMIKLQLSDKHCLDMYI